MTIDRELWYDKAMGLPIGYDTVGKHPTCAGNGGEDRDVLFIYNNTTGVGCYCNRCHSSSFVPHGTLTLEDLERMKVAQQQLQEEMDENPTNLPRSCSTNFTKYARIWLAKAGITVPEAITHGIKIDDHTGRVILPIYNGIGELVYYQARGVEPNHNPKYLNPKSGKDEAIPLYGKGTGDILIVTEDIASAIRVGRDFDAMSALGTHLSPAMVRYIINNYARVGIWLDGDGAGVRGRTEMHDALSFFVDVYHIETTDDPKAYSQAEIRNYIQEELDDDKTE